jgi:hypothetical protein
MLMSKHVEAHCEVTNDCLLLSTAIVGLKCCVYVEFFVLTFTVQLQQTLICVAVIFVDTLYIGL